MHNIFLIFFYFYCCLGHSYANKKFNTYNDCKNQAHLNFPKYSPLPFLINISQNKGDLNFLCIQYKI